MAKQNITWVIAHEPNELFIRAANQFAKDVNAKSDDFAFEALTLKEYSEQKCGGADVSYEDLLTHMAEGKIQMSQMFTTTLGKEHNRDMWALDMPFLFSDHDHATRVFEGSIGSKMLNGMKDGIKGLAFTYSGGFRMLPSDRDVSGLADLKGMRVRVHEQSPISAETFKAVGATAVPLKLEEINEGVQKGMIDSGESTYPRYLSLKQNEALPTINDTAHSLFLTSILIGDEFWASLTEAQQSVIQNAATVAATSERTESIKDIAKTEALCKEQGITINRLAETVRNERADKTAYMYDKYSSMFSSNLLASIKAA